MHYMLAEAQGVGDFLAELRDRTFKPHQAFTVGEVFDIKPDEIGDFIGEDGYFSSMFDFGQTIIGSSELGSYAAKQPTPEQYKASTFESQHRVKEMGFLSNIIENHDEPRGVSHYIPQGDCGEQSKKMLAAVYFLKKGIPFIYQGQEIGMENVPFPSIEDIDDIATLEEYQVAIRAGLEPQEALQRVLPYSRDNARTPMQWTAGANAGFTNGKPWLMVNPTHADVNVEQELNNPDSVYNFYKQLIALRKNSQYQDTLVYGELEPVLQEAENILAYARKGEKNTILVLANFQNEPQKITLPEGYRIKEVLLTNEEGQKTGIEIFLNGYEVIIAECAKNV